MSETSNRQSTAAERLGAASFRIFDETITVRTSDVRAVLRELSDTRSTAECEEVARHRLAELLRDDAEWRTRADNEPLRSVVAVLLGAVKRGELGPQESPRALAVAVANRMRELEDQLRRELARQDRIVATAGFPGLAIVDVREAKS